MPKRFPTGLHLLYNFGAEKSLHSAPQTGGFMVKSIRSIRKNTAILLASVLAFFALVFSSLLYFEQRSVLETKVTEADKKMVMLFENHLKRLARVYLTRLSEISDSEEFTAALAAEDREKVIRILTPKYEALKRNNPYLNIMHVHTQDSRSFVRMHMPDKYGDSLSAYRDSVSEVNSGLHPVYGFEVGAGGLYYRVIRPVIDSKGRHLGSIEVGIEPQYFYETVREFMPELIPYISVAKSSLSPTDAGAEGRIYHSGGENALLIEEYADTDKEMIESGSKIYAVCRGAVFNNFRGHEAAVLRAFYDVTDARLVIAEKTFLFFSLSVLLFILLYLIMRKGFESFLSYYSSRNTELDSLYALFDEGSTVIFRWNNTLNWDVTFCTGNVRRIFGYEPEDFCSGYVKYVSVIHKEDLGRVIGEVKSSVESGVESFIHEPYRIVSKNKGARWVFDSTKIIRDESGKALHFQGYICDITDLYTETDELKANLSRYKLAVDASGIGLWDWNLLTDEVSFSPEWKAMLGYDEKEIKGSSQSWRDLLHAADRDKVAVEVGKMLSGESERLAYEFRMKCRDGSYRWVSSFAKTIFSEDGRPLRAVGLHIDITDRKLLEIRLDDNGRFLEVLLENLPVPVFYKDRSLKYIGCNQRFLEFMGAQSKDEIIGHRDFNFLDAKQSDIQSSYDKLALEDTGRMHEYEVDLTTLRGNRRKVIIYKRAFKNSAGEPAGVIGAFADVTEMKSLQRMLMNNAEEVHRAKKDLDDAQALAKIGSWRYEIGTGRMVWSDEHYRILGLESGSVIPSFELFLEFVGKRDRDRIKEVIDGALKERKAFSEEHVLNIPGQEHRHVHMRGSVITGENGSPVALIGTLQDVTDIKNAQLALDRMNRMLSEYTEIVDKNVIVSRTDLNGRILYVSEAFCRAAELPREELIGRTHSVLSHPDMDREVYKDLWETITWGNVWKGELKNRSGKGNDYWIYATISPTYGKSGRINGYTAVSTDITVKKQMERLSVTDPLTGLYNRLRLDTVFRKELERCERYGCALSVILIDVDGFKSINDSYGHQTGDIVLREAAEVLRNNIRKTDTIGRWGGEEFLIICPETDLEGSVRLAEKLRTAVAGYEFMIVGSVTCSIGVTEYEENAGESVMMKAADQALYQAKREGRNRVVSRSVVAG
ncbi:PAS domain S-box protein [Geovibrio thiophilus]|uniref:PAS domain S-box protein n=1 Tax=Geovibrio thiophilus TaxID=139438 RepID=A0A3R5XVC5_9BACT|nr:PAS domain-containing protein [Geovibrio thiophilus]QAR32039.1 PAS domain S-box protein [Geovibrio thiophilus]